MSAPEFTPGPWVWGAIKSGSAGLREPSEIEYLKQTGAACDLSLYGCGQNLSAPVVVRLDVERYEAFPSEGDAALIASAPELYEELDKADALLVDMRNALREARRTGNYAPALELLACEFEQQPKRERALAKARGEG